MEHTLKPRVKIGGIGSVQEACLAVQYGASALGFVSSRIDDPCVIDDSLIASIISSIPPMVASFLTTGKQDVQAIIEQQHQCRANTLQFRDRLEMMYYNELRSALPGICLVQVIHVTNQSAVEDARALAPYVDGLLLDTDTPPQDMKEELSCSESVNPWSVCCQIRRMVNIPIILAGGLNVDNVAYAIEQVGPFGLDVYSSVRTDGRLDETKRADFFAQIEHVRLQHS